MLAVDWFVKSLLSFCQEVRTLVDEIQAKLQETLETLQEEDQVMRKVHDNVSSKKAVASLKKKSHRRKAKSSSDEEESDDDDSGDDRAVARAAKHPVPAKKVAASTGKKTHRRKAKMSSPDEESNVDDSGGDGDDQDRAVSAKHPAHTERRTSARARKTSGAKRFLQSSDEEEDPASPVSRPAAKASGRLEAAAQDSASDEEFQKKSRPTRGILHLTRKLQGISPNFMHIFLLLWTQAIARRPGAGDNLVRRSHTKKCFIYNNKVCLAVNYIPFSF